MFSQPLRRGVDGGLWASTLDPVGIPTPMGELLRDAGRAELGLIE